MRWSKKTFLFKGLKYPVFSKEQWETVDRHMVEIGRDVIGGPGMIYPGEILKYLPFQQMIREKMGNKKKVKPE